MRCICCQESRPHMPWRPTGTAVKRDVQSPCTPRSPHLYALTRRLGAASAASHIRRTCASPPRRSVRGRLVRSGVREGCQRVQSCSHRWTRGARRCGEVTLSTKDKSGPDADGCVTVLIRDYMQVRGLVHVRCMHGQVESLQADDRLRQTVRIACQVCRQCKTVPGLCCNSVTVTEVT